MSDRRHDHRHGIHWCVLDSRIRDPGADGFEVLLVNARDVKNVPGRKTDINDAQWLQQLHHVVIDITGVTGMKIIRGIVGGEYDPHVLAKYRDVRCKESVETICEALTGNYRSEHVFALRHALELYDFIQAKIGESDAEIECALHSLNADQPPPADPIPHVRHRRGQNEPQFDVRGALYTMLGTDLKSTAWVPTPCCA